MGDGMCMNCNCNECRCDEDPENVVPLLRDSIKTCPQCGKNSWLPIPDSLASYCECGFVRVLMRGGGYEKGASLQQWAKDTYERFLPPETQNQGTNDE